MSTQTTQKEGRVPEETQRSQLVSKYFPYWMSLPSIIFIAVIVGFPILYLLFLSVTENVFAVGQPVNFVGISHYAAVLNAPQFWTFLFQTWAYAAAILGIGIPLQIGITIALNADLPFKRIWQTLIILPWAIPFVISSLIWKLMFQPQFGLINYLLIEIGLINQPILWFSSQLTAFFAITITTIWINTPLGVLILLAGMKNIPSNMYEATRIAGAGILGRFRHVTIPLLKPAIVSVLILQSMLALRGFDIIWTMTKGGPGTATTVLAVDIYQQLITFGKTGYAAAESVILVLMILIVLVIITKMTGEDIEEGV